MELIIAFVLFVALVACWIVLPASPELAHKPAASPADTGVGSTAKV